MEMGRYFIQCFIKGVKLLDLDFFTKSDPYAKFYKLDKE